MAPIHTTYSVLLAGAVSLALVALSVAHSGDGQLERFTMPQPTWFTEALVEASKRRLLHAATASCVIRIIGTGDKFGVESAYINCTGGTPNFYAGTPLVNLYNSNPENFIGVSLRLPNEPDFLGPGNAEPCLFMVGAGSLNLTGYIRSMSLVDWGSIVVENGTTAVIDNFEWSNNYGVRFPTLAVSRSTVSITNSTWAGNVCTDQRRCHTGGLYVTEGATVTLTSSSFRKNRGHLAGAMMVTAGAQADVVGNSFQGNSVGGYGNPAGAIFHDYCRTNRVSTIMNNRFVKNSSNGFAGAIRVGSPDGGCRPVIAGNLFQQNKAKITGGAVYWSYCNGTTPTMTKNRFISNTASMFAGQIGYNPNNKPRSQGGGSTGGAGCGKPRNSGNSFSGGQRAYCSPWYFP